MRARGKRGEQIDQVGIIGGVRGCATKCPPDEAFQVAAEARAFLVKHGIDLGGEQQTKTRTALEFFSNELG